CARARARGPVWAEASASTEPSGPVSEAQPESVATPEAGGAEPMAEAQTAPSQTAQAVAEAGAPPEASEAVAATIDPWTGSSTETGEAVDGDPRLAALGLSADGPEPDAATDEAQIDAMREATIAARPG